MISPIPTIEASMARRREWARRFRKGRATRAEVGRTRASVRGDAECPQRAPIVVFVVGRMMANIVV